MTYLDVSIDGGNLADIIGVMVPLAAVIGGLSLAFAIRYLKSKERMEMISRGMDVSAFKDLDIAETMRKNRRKSSPLRSGLICLGAGFGLLISYGLCHTIFTGDDNPVIYFGVITLFVGVALVVSHMLEKKSPLDDTI